MSRATVIASLKTLVEGVDNVGLVYDYQRLATDFETLLGFFRTKISGVNVIRGWMITCTGVAHTEWVKTGAWNTGNELVYSYAIRGFFGVDDSADSEAAAFVVAKAVLDAVTSSTLWSDGGTNSNFVSATLPQLTFNYRNLGGVLCHFAEITLTVTERT